MLTAAAAVLYFNRVDLPAWLKRPLISALQRRGVDVRFDRLRWRWHRGLVAEGVSLRRAGRPRDPVVQAGEIVLDLNWKRLRDEQRIEIESCQILDGRLTLPIEPPGASPEFLSLDAINATLRFQKTNQWDLERFHAEFLGATLNASGTLTNALRLQPIPAVAQHTNTIDSAAERWHARLREFVRASQRIEFASPPAFRLRFGGDASDLRSLEIELEAQTRGARTPWGAAGDLRLSVQLDVPPPSPDAFRVGLRLVASDAHTSWGQCRRVDLTAHSVHTVTNALATSIEYELALEGAQATNCRSDRVELSGRSEPLIESPGRWRSHLTLDARGLASEWGTVRTNRLEARLVHSLTNPVPDHARILAMLDQVESQRFSAAQLGGDLEFHPHLSTATAPATLGPFTAPNRIDLAGSVSATAARFDDLNFDSLLVAGNWSAPVLHLTNVQARLDAGTLELSEARLDAATREATVAANFALDAHALAPMLGRDAERFLRQFGWETAKPPRVRANARAILPAWTNAAPDWRAEVLPTVVLTGTIEGETVTYRGVPVDRALVNLSLSNQVLRLSDFHMVRPEGDGDLAYTLDTRTREFRWQVRCRFDPIGVAPAIDHRALEALRLFAFSEPVCATGAVWGCWGPHYQLNLDLDLALTNFTFRGESIASAAGNVCLANRFLSATNVDLRAGLESIAVPWIGMNLDDPVVQISDARCRVDPLRVARAIGTNVLQTLEPYRFDAPVRARVSGQIPTLGPLDPADLRVDFDGDTFHYWRFNLDRLAGRLHWQGNLVTLTNLAGRLYGGDVAGNVQIRMRPDASADLAFRAAVTNLNARDLLADTVTTTNSVAGRLEGALDIAHANSADWKSWNGAGALRLRDGMLWDLPLFSVLSPILNSIAPGLGNNKATAARGAFTIENSVIHTDDLEIVAGPARLGYRGTLDFDWNVRARVEAEILPGAPLIGPVLNILLLPVTKALVFKVGGTLGQPELEPLYIPKFLLPVLRPWHTLKSVVPGASNRP